MATANQTTKTATASQSESEELSRQIEAIRLDIGALTELIADMGRSRKEAAAQQAQQKVTELRAKAEAAGSEAMDRVGALGERAQAQLREQPGTTLLIATGIGFLAGLLLSRK